MLSSDTASRELPRYKCFKEVWALKIKALEYAPKPTIAELESMLRDEEEVPLEVLPDGSVTPKEALEAVGATITPEDSDYAPFTVTKGYVAKHNPQAGGYYVVYKDGYKSFSPAQAFEEGYTPIP